jgi:hypothetical protein
MWGGRGYRGRRRATALGGRAAVSRRRLPWMAAVVVGGGPQWARGRGRRPWARGSGRARGARGGRG